MSTVDVEFLQVNDSQVRVGEQRVCGLVLPQEVAAELAGRLLERARLGEPLRLSGQDGIVSDLLRQVLEAGLRMELDQHLGQDRLGGNGRNGSSEKVVATEIGPIRLQVPRDRAGTFEPLLLPKHSRRTPGLSAQVTSLYAGGLSVRDISRHLERTCGIDISHDTVSRITDESLEEMRAWQVRPLDPIYPIVFIDAMMVKVREGSSVRSKAVNIAIGMDLDGTKRVLGIWVSAAESSKIWAQALSQLRNRGLEDVLIVCSDGLPGLGAEIVETWPAATAQTCVVHLIRAAVRYASYTDRKNLCAALKPIYTAVDADAAYQALLEFADSPLGRRHPAAAAVFERAWDRFIPFLEFAPAVRKIIYTTNCIEAFNRQMRKVIKTRGHFPSDDAVVKLLWLAIVDLEERRDAERAAEKGLPAQQRRAPGHLIEGASTHGWREAMAAFEAAWPGRIPATAL